MSNVCRLCDQSFSLKAILGRKIIRKLSQAVIASRSPTPSVFSEDTLAQTQNKNNYIENEKSEWSGSLHETLPSYQYGGKNDDLENMFEHVQNSAEEPIAHERPVYVVVNYIINYGNLTINQARSVKLKLSCEQRMGREASFKQKSFLKHLDKHA